jgi:hypothetical protein
MPLKIKKLISKYNINIYYQILKMTTSSIMSIYFKVARTTRTAFYNVDLNWTIEQFINIMREKVIEDFNLENAEFVDTAQELIIGMAAEDAPALTPSNRTIRDYYGEHIYTLAFYIRPLPLVEDGIAMDVQPAEEMPAFPRERACAICLQRERTLLFMPCNHLCACAECGLNPTIRTCPVCRAAFNNQMVIYV